MEIPRRLVRWPTTLSPALSLKGEGAFRAACKFLRSLTQLLQANSAGNAHSGPVPSPFRERVRERAAASKHSQTAGRSNPPYSTSNLGNRNVTRNPPSRRFCNVTSPPCV